MPSAPSQFYFNYNLDEITESQLDLCTKFSINPKVTVTDYIKRVFRKVIITEDNEKFSVPATNEKQPAQ